MIDVKIGQVDPNRQLNEDVSFIDADTITTEDGSVRFANINAPETQHIVRDDTVIPWLDDQVKITQDEFQGEELTDEIARLAREGGYDNVWTEGSDDYGRGIGGLRNAAGEDLGERAAYEDVTPWSQYDSDRLNALRDMGAVSDFGNKNNKDIFDESKSRLEQHSRDNFLGWKGLAVDEASLAQYSQAQAAGFSGPTYGRYRTDDVQFRHEGQSVDGEAYNSFTTGVRGGGNTITGSFYGAASAIGDLINNKGLYDWGRIRAISQDDDQAELGTFMNNIGDVDGARDFGRYASGMVGQMLPYLAGLWAAGSVGALIGGPIGAIVAVGTPTLVYAGEIYNGMEGKAEDKNVGYAFAGGLIAATVDRLALKGLVGNTSGLVEKDAKKQLAAAFKEKFDVTQEAAEEAVSRAFAGSQAQLMKELGLVQLKANKGAIAKEIGMGIGKNAPREGLTEMFQEGTIYGSQVAGSPKEWNQDEFESILANAATGGFLIGGAIGGISNASSIDGFLRLQHDWRAEDSDARRGMYEGTTESNLDKASKEAAEKQKKASLEAIDVAKLVNDEVAKGEAADTIREGGFKNWLYEAPSLYFKKVGDRIMNEYAPHVNEKAKFYLSTLTGNFANTTNSTMAGVSHKKSKLIVQSLAKREVTIIENDLTNQMGYKANKKGKAQTSRDLRSYMRAKDKGEVTPAHLKANEEALAVAASRMNLATDKVLDIVNNQTGQEIKGQTNYFGSATRLDPSKVLTDRKTFNELAEWLGYDKDETQIFYDQIMGSPEGYQSSKLEQLGFRNATEPGSLKETTANIKDFPGIDKLMSDNMFDQMRSITDEDINYALDMNRLGEKGAKVDAMLYDLKKEMGADWDPRIASWIKDSIAASRGDYRKIKSKFGSNLQEWVMWFNAITQLDTSTLASLPEIAMIFYGAGQKGKAGADIAKASKGVGRFMMRNYEKNRAKWFKDYGVSEEDYDAAVEDFYRLGFDAEHSSAAALESSVAGEGTGKKFREKTIQAFFKLNLLSQFTDASRVARLSLAGQAIITDIETMLTLGDLKNNMNADAYGRLRDLNVDPDLMAEKYDDFISNIPPELDRTDTDAIFKELVNNPANAELLTMFDNAKTSYVDNVLARPTHEDRPLWYSNPHYKWALQFTGFLSTFTANTIPRIYRDIKKSNPAARYQATAAALTMIAMGFLGQEMKDEIYDRSWAETPQGLAYYQRGLQSSGLLGTGERWLDAIHPVYGEAGILNFSAQQGLSLGDSVEAQFGPSYSTAGKFGQYIDKLASGKDTEGLGTKLLPGGRLASSWDSITGGYASDYLFNGE